MHIQIAAHASEVQRYLAAYHIMKAHEFTANRNGMASASEWPYLRLTVEGQEAETAEAEPLAESKAMLVLIDSPSRSSYRVGAILVLQGEWWAPLAPAQLLPDSRGLKVSPENLVMRDIRLLGQLAGLD